MGFFGLFNRNKKSVGNDQPNQSAKESNDNLLLAMPMFNNDETFDSVKVTNYLKGYWDVNVIDVQGNNDTLAFSADGEMIVLGTIDRPIPKEEIEGAAAYAYNWPAALDDLQNHTSHVLVTMMSGNTDIIERCKIFTKVLHSILATSNCIGIYQGTQTLLIPKLQFIERAEVLKDNNEIPVNLWVYIGLRSTEKGNNAYTYGLNNFGKSEMEFINASLELDDLYELLYNTASYVLNSNITFKSGETLGYTAEQKIKITQSQGIFTAGQTLKFEL